VLGKITQVVWTRQARESLTSILDYRYKDLPDARKIVRKNIIEASKKIVFAEQYQ
jgi:plasmid stabilization system protein ParE